MNRRDVLVSATAGLGLLAASVPAFAQARPDADKKPAPKADPRAALLAALAECRRTGELCLGHCARQLASGDKAFGHCNVAVQAMLAATAATATLAALDAPQAKKLAALCAEVCKECESACAEHKAHFAHGMHLECRDCMEACIACEKACADYAK